MTSKLTYSDAFICRLKCDQCSFLKKDGTKCKNRVCIGYPFCWIHTLKIGGIRLRRSTLPGVQKGLFSDRSYRAGDWIFPFLGEFIDEECYSRRYPRGKIAPYAVLTGDQKDPDTIKRYLETDNGAFFVDAACQRGIASMANGLYGQDLQMLPKTFHNCSYEWRDTDVGSGVWLRAIADIPAGTELFAYKDDGDLNPFREQLTARNRKNEARPC
jgi:hypothetical protein